MPDVQEPPLRVITDGMGRRTIEFDFVSPMSGGQKQPIRPRMEPMFLDKVLELCDICAEQQKRIAELEKQGKK
jgi:hypothetical protein